MICGQKEHIESILKCPAVSDVRVTESDSVRQRNSPTVLGKAGAILATSEVAEGVVVSEWYNLLSLLS